MSDLTLIYLNRVLLVANLAIAIGMGFWFCWFASGFLALVVLQGIDLERTIRRESA